MGRMGGGMGIDFGDMGGDMSGDSLGGMNMARQRGRRNMAMNGMGRGGDPVPDSDYQYIGDRYGRMADE